LLRSHAGDGRPSPPLPLCRGAFTAPVSRRGFLGRTAHAFPTVTEASRPVSPCASQGRHHHATTWRVATRRWLRCRGQAIMDNPAVIGRDRTIPVEGIAAARPRVGGFKSLTKRRAASSWSRVGVAEHKPSFAKAHRIRRRCATTAGRRRRRLMWLRHRPDPDLHQGLYKEEEHGSVLGVTGHGFADGQRKAEALRKERPQRRLDGSCETGGYLCG
jgi:hypothetical protein